MNRLILLFVILLNVDAWAGWTPPLQLSEDAVFYSPKIIANGNILHVVENMAFPEISINYQCSLDGGNSWSPAYLLPDSEVTTGCGLPSMVMKENRIYVSWVNFESGGSYRQNVGFAVSTNAGITWAPGRKVLIRNRDYIAAQTLGIMGDVVYIIFVHGTQQGYYFYIVDSYDYGQTWSEPREMFVGHNVSEIKTVSLGDTIHVLWSGELESQSPGLVFYLRSSDGGYAWSDNYSIRDTNDSSGGVLPSMTHNERGELIACWTDYRYSPYWITGDIFYRISTDGGDSWSDEVQITDLHLTMESSVVWIEDSIYIAYEDRRYEDREILFRKSLDNGLSWGEEERLSDDPDDTRDPCVSVSDGKIYVVWSRIIDNPYSGGVYITHWEPDVGIDETEQKSHNFGQPLRAYPNPFNDHTMIEFTASEPSEISIYNLLGQVIYSRIVPAGKGSFKWDAAGYSSGIYFYKLTSGEKTITKRVTLLK
jgi:hypothetical protein